MLQVSDSPFLTFWSAGGDGAPVGYGGGHDECVGVPTFLENGVSHLQRGADGHNADAYGLGQRGRSGHDDGGSATVAGGLRDGVTHLPGRAVGDNTDGVQWLLGASRADNNLATGEVARLPSAIFTYSTSS